jgi:hypothetical protein
MILEFTAKGKKIKFHYQLKSISLLLLLQLFFRG